MKANETPHPLLPERNHDEQARQDFVTDLRRFLSTRLMPGNREVYEKRVRPAFRRDHERDPESVREVRERMTRDGYYQFWSATQRRSQELMWDSVIDPAEREHDELIARYRNASAARAAGGSLELDDELVVPRYHTAVDIHIQPGGYHSDFAEDDVAAGVLYEGGLPIYIGGALGPDSDGIGRSLVEFAQSTWPDLAPDKILDMGCAVGNSTLPWHAAFPDAELHAIDVAAPCLRYGHARAEAYGVPVHFSQQNAEKTRYDDDSFDLVVSHIVLHETSKPALRNIVTETFRVLKPCGLMLHLDVPRGEGAFEQFMFQWETYNNNETFSAYMTDADLPALALDAGFEPDSVEMARAPAGVYDGQKSYSSGDFSWPVLVGRKPA